MILPHREKLSRQSIERMLELSKNPYIALSFGKDSLVMLDLVRQYVPDIPCRFLKSSETYLLANYEEIIDYYVSDGVNLHVVNTDRISEADSWKGARDLGDDDMEKLLNEGDFDGVFMGLREEESRARKITLKCNNQYGFRVMRYKSGKRKGWFRCCPISSNRNRLTQKSVFTSSQSK